MVNIFQCHPVQFFFDKSIRGGTCIKGQTQFFVTMGALSLIEDVAILIMPMPIIWSLNIHLRQRIALTLIFALGTMYVPVG